MIKKIATKFILGSLSAVAALSVFASDKDATDYQLVAYKDCEIVHQAALNDSQMQAYLDLKGMEKEMEFIVKPLGNFEQEIEHLSAKIEKITEEAVTDDGKTIVIKKHLLKEQEDLADKITKIVKIHQPELDAIEINGEKIEKIAELFEQEIKPELEGIDHDMVRIVSKDDSGEISCDKGHHTSFHFSD